ncbi:tail protein X [Cereibacter azotoformans]|uniref:Phage tail protein X n=1 Tax=Cereibacter azotoformans TaxID=43057 RepID=A0A2T5JWZ5_9RHOB|nr:tail protein X [Cereibacter azotoformans]AXQ92999.1 phage tail protein [Cereibacter sphaeroides]MBO4169313.1 tail protein X [Cereibacter azotoformans]PTR14588.1 phage tail protein X [Cereibacter azotoformans]UIJ31299.1 tail protein X [Cereibacter azotoformans]
MTPTTYDNVTVNGDGITLPLLIWRRFKRPVPGVIEATLDANPGLAALGPVLPIGTNLRIPIPTPEAEKRPAERISLW